MSKREVTEGLIKRNNVSYLIRAIKFRRILWMWMGWACNPPVIHAIGVQNFSHRIERKTPGLRRMTSMRHAGRDAGVEMGRALSTNKKSKWT